MGAKFTSPLIVEIVHDDDERPVLLSAPLMFTTSWGYQVDVPAGFRSDLASIPALVRPFWSRLEGETAAAAVLHDYLYTVHITSRREADRLFYEALGATGVRPYKRWAMWLAVRLFGGRSWLKDIIEYRLAAAAE